jgi:hypothetical protein
VNASIIVIREDVLGFLTNILNQIKRKDMIKIGITETTIVAI